MALLKDLKPGDKLSNYNVISNEFDGVNYRLVIDTKLTTFSKELFNNDKTMSYIEVPLTVTTIDNECFSNFTNLQNVVISNSVTSIGNNVFDGCSSIKEITIPSNVTTLGDNIVNNCSNLTNINLFANADAINSDTFANINTDTKIKVLSNNLETYQSKIDSTKLITPTLSNIKVKISGDNLTDELIKQSIPSIYGYK